MLTEICQYLRNWFLLDKYEGTFTIQNGELLDMEDNISPNQYIRIIGSRFNDGVYQYGTDTLTDEEFTGAVWALGIPKAILDLAAEIGAWQTKYGNVENPNMSPFSSESFGGYSYSKAQGYAGEGGGMLNTWQAIFAARLAPWRKI